MWLYLSIIIKNDCKTKLFLCMWLVWDASVCMPQIMVIEMEKWICAFANDLYSRKSLKNGIVTPRNSMPHRFLYWTGQCVIEHSLYKRRLTKLKLSDLHINDKYLRKNTDGQNITLMKYNCVSDFVNSYCTSTQFFPFFSPHPLLNLHIPNAVLSEVSQHAATNSKDRCWILLSHPPSHTYSCH